MIDFEKFTLENGLRIIVHEDKSTPIAAMNILYNVGARNEDPSRTGFAHLFEHLMFGGSVNIIKYDEPLERVGGENNAFTNNDITNYYLTLPTQNIETAFWLESDRMLNLAFSPKSLEVQQKVVVEEFNQNYLNQPYGDVWLLLRPLAYKLHPYQWPTIGKDPDHIKNATLEEVKSFYESYYNPVNAIMSITGNVSADQIRGLAEKWFAPIKNKKARKINIPPEPAQKGERRLEVVRDVPFDSIFKVYHMCRRTDPEYYSCDLLSDILANGDSSRFYDQLVRRKKIFSDIDAYITGNIDPGLFVISGKPAKGIALHDAEKAITEELDKISNEVPGDYELQKVKNKVEANIEYSEVSILHRGMNLCFSELIEEAGLVNTEVNRYRKVSAVEVRDQAAKLMQPSNCSTLYYKAKKK